MSIIYAIDLIGTLVFAISGVLTGISKRFDIFGASVLGFVTSVGGGTLRDMLTGSLPVSWIQDINYVLIIFLAVPLVYFFRKTILKLRKTMFLFDSIGIGLFTVLGVQKCLDLGLSPVICVLMGAISAVFGGVLRDTLSNEVPLIFRKEIYATACLLGGMVYLFMSSLSIPLYIAQAGSVLIIIVIRVLAVKNHWSLHIHRESK
ncbi:trimeric intracellular cation channel family protein [Portibacter marinus]|uniref:trimeric intracellular cation channel family protein n=1 Tax=Portibacter marinus TaxID=2898660 RepID=UPI001F48EC3D|nr:trimeric intracellular cation channel family protein [Portibacter marinus]